MTSTAAATLAHCKATVFGFGPFRYDAVRRELFDARGSVRVGSRALQLLEVLLESPGRLYSRDELVSRVWPRTVVEETSLRVHMSALRRLLGDGQGGARYITNVPGRGYAFVGELQVSSPPPLPAERPRTPASAPPPAPAATVATVATRTQRRLPARLTRPIGRDTDVARLGDLLSRQRLVTLVGAGGIGKTTVALAVAERQARLHEHGAFFVDLSPVSDAAQVVVEVGQACGLDVARGEPWATLEGGLRGQQALIVLDNCEHVIDAAAALADRLLRACPGLRILATSREALAIETEWVFKLPPLDTPAPQAALGLEAVLAYPAIQLFVERARAACDTFELTEANVAAVRQLCEFLEGMPLVLELAAARVNSLGAQGLLLRLESALELLTRGRRIAMSRHQTLHAVLNWSYELLSDPERHVLQRLAVFSGMFDLEDAMAVAASPDLPADRVTDAVLSLCAKSLVTSEPAGDGLVAHRLLHITRLFATRALAGTPDAPAVRRRHALHMHHRLVEANRQPTALPRYRDSLARSTVIAELKSAIRWALLEEHDLLLGLEIVAESVALYITTGFVDECERFLIAAIDRLDKAGAVGSRLEYLLQDRITKLHGQALVDSETKARAVARLRELAPAFCSPLERIEALYAECGSAYGEGRYPQSLAVCEEIRALTQGEHAPLSVTVADRLAALNLHALGRHDAAEQLAQRVMHVDTSNQPWGLQSAVPAAVAMGIQLARIHWLRGDFRQAWAAVHAAIARDASAHLYARCQPLGMAAIPIALWQGDLDTAARWTQELLAHSTQAGMLYWQAFAQVHGCVVEGRPVLPGSPEA